MGSDRNNDDVAIANRPPGSLKGLRLRVDYAARATFIHDPDLKLNQCGLPKAIVLQLFRPFIIRRMLDAGFVEFVEDAEAMLGRPVEFTGKFAGNAWISSAECDAILEEVISDHPVLLSRAPSLNRSGIQAFQPVMTTGNVIRIHPLVFQGFDCEQDGDQVTVHLPLSQEAQREASTRMMPANNLYGTANGAPVFNPSRDIVLGCYYATISPPALGRSECLGDGMYFASPREVDMAYALGKVAIHATVGVRLPKEKRVRDGEEQESPTRGIIKTTVGRVLFNEILPPEMAFYNQVIKYRDLGSIVDDCFRELGQSQTIELLERITQFGVRELTRSGCSIAVSDLNLAQDKAAVVAEAEKRTERYNRHYHKGFMGPTERYNQVMSSWQNATDTILTSTLASLGDNESYKFNPLSLIAYSGAGIGVAQIKRLAGMHGNVSKWNDKLFEIPIKSNFREGLSLVEYFMSIFNPRRNRFETLKKGRRTRFLARQLVHACGHVAITEHDCGTTEGIRVGAECEGTLWGLGLLEAIVGRISLRSIQDPLTGQCIVQKNELVTPEIVRGIEAIGLKEILVRSPLNCQTEQGICQCCFGWDLSTTSLVNVGARVGMIAAQAIGESASKIPDLYSRFRSYESSSKQSEISSRVSGVVRLSNSRIVRSASGASVEMSRKATAAIYGDNDRLLTTYDIPIGAELHVAENEHIKREQRICSWNPYSIPVLSNASGWVHIEDFVEGITVRTDKGRNGESYVKILKTSSDLEPRILVKDRSGKVLDCHYLYLNASCDLVTNQFVNEGEILALYPRVNESHFLGGMSHAVELLKGNRPPAASTLAQCSGEVRNSAERIFGKRLILVRTSEGKEVAHLVSRDSRIQVFTKDRVFAGDRLTEGPLDPNEVLSIMGVEAAQKALLEGLRRHFALPPRPIGLQHLEMVVAQMMRWLEIDDPGDGALSSGDVIDRTEFNKTNQALRSSVRVIEPGDSGFRAGDIVIAEIFNETNDALRASNSQTAKMVDAFPATGHVRILGIEEIAKQLDVMKFHRAIGEKATPLIQRISTV